MRDVLPSAAADPLLLSGRRQVWPALADLFRGRQSVLTRNWRVVVLAASPYSVDELERILIDEVFPVCRRSAPDAPGTCPIGVETRFCERPPTRRSWLGDTVIGRLLVPTCREWRATKVGVAAARRGPAPL